jgi:GTP cyclohydrolase II
VTPAELAVRALRRGAAVDVCGMSVRSVETSAAGGARLLISHERATALKLANQRAAAGEGGAVALEGPFSRAEALAVADPALDLATPLKGPFRAATAPQAATAAIELARRAELLPALFWDEGGADMSVTAEEIAAYDAAAQLAQVGRARLPVAGGGTGELIAFRSGGGGPEHLALILGHPVLSEPVLTRVHSSCLTGDVFGSLRCDCGPQLDAAIEALSGGGILLYLQQEGRGIGLVNKLRAYQLQDQGWDTLDANLRVGLPAEARDFRIAAAMLAALGVRAVRLLTNNPEKVAALEAAGVTVTEHVPLAVGAGPENERYLETKRDRAGHWLPRSY